MARTDRPVKKTAKKTPAAPKSTTKGLRIPRRFSTEGLHPYDEVKWVTRDVVQNDWRTGATIFEQRQVEFPASWSDNAVTIATTKYFRGKPGSAARETSLRQLIDRVADTYVAAGKDNGYFATEADADVFSDELKWLLLNQHFAFNSPVWFNVGTSSKPQVSACQPYNALVSTPAGMVPIGKLVEENAVGTKIYDAEGVTKITATKANGRKEVLRLHLHSGQSLDVTKDHLVWKSNGPIGQGKFVEAESLSVGDRLEWHRRESYGESEVSAYDLQEAALVGWLQSDGFVGKYEHGTNRSYTIEAMTVNDAELRWVTDSINSIFPDVHRKERTVETQNKELDCRRTRLYGEKLRPFITKWDLLVRGRDMQIPESMFTAPLPIVAAYLRSIFQAEGFVSEREATNTTLIGVGMVSEQIIKGMQTLLMRFGIFSRVQFKNDPRPSRQGGHWCLNIQNLGDRITFANEIGFIDSKKTEKLHNSFSQQGLPAKETKRLTIKKIENLGNMEVYDIQTESGEYLSENLKVHNCFILSVADTMDSILNWYREEGLIFKGGSGAGVNLSALRSSREHLHSGGTASGPVSFMRGADASAGTIKSGGATRRAAKMVVLDVDHPDIEEFIETKVHEEAKIRALRDAGFDMDLGGKDIISVQYQNANNSVRVDDAFMRAVQNKATYPLTARADGAVMEEVDAAALFRTMAEAAWECADPGIQYKDTINSWHTNPNTGPITASNPCAEFLSLDNSSCNLASLNLLKFYSEEDGFDEAGFVAAIDVIITAMDISICFGHFPTEAITEVTKNFRQLGIGYSNLGALLMTIGMPYDSDEGRAVAGSITSLMSGAAWRRSAELAGAVGPYNGFAQNKEPHTRVIERHSQENSHAKNSQRNIVYASHMYLAAEQQWDEALRLGRENGWRNAQCSLLAPTGCLTADTLVNTSHGLLRLDEIGNPNGATWQDLTNVTVATDEGARGATKFFVNGEEPTRRVVTKYGTELTGTYRHQLKVYNPETCSIEWKHMMDIREGDMLTLPRDTFVGTPRPVPLPVLEQPYYAGHTQVSVPTHMTAELAELVGYFMGDGSLHSKGIRLCAADSDPDIVTHLEMLTKSLFKVEASTTAQQGYSEVMIQSTAVARWWQAAGFAKTLPNEGHIGKGWIPHIPTAIRETNDPDVWRAFLRGLFEADGTASLIASTGNPTLSTKDKSFVVQVAVLFRALGYATTLKVAPSGTGRWGKQDYYRIRLRNLKYVQRWIEEIGFISARKTANTLQSLPKSSGRQDRISVDPDYLFTILEQSPTLRNQVRNRLGASQRRNGANELSRDFIESIFETTGDETVGRWLDYWYEPVVENCDGGLQLTYDISVPDNVTYVANGVTSHNTISFLLDCDTTGIEPDFSLVKHKKLVGGGSMKVVNQGVERALRNLGYNENVVEAAVEHVAETGTIEGAPGVDESDYAVFDCAVGERSISPDGHILMMAAAQPFLSGSISKCVTGDTVLYTEEGLVRIKNLYRGETPDSFRDHYISVASDAGFRKTDAFYYGGVRPVRTMKLRSGHTITGTPNHKVMVGCEEGLVWKTLEHIQPGDYVAQRYGTEVWSTVPTSLTDFTPLPKHGSQKTVNIPTEMTSDLAFLLGAYASEGHTQRSTWSIVITNNCEEVLTKVSQAWKTVFGVDAKITRQDNKCPGVLVASKTIVEFFEHLGTGSRARNKRIPDAVLGSTREHVLAFMEGLNLDGYTVTRGSVVKWAICLDSAGMLDDIQAVLTNLGVVHSRIEKYNKDYDKTYGEVYASGEQAHKLLKLVGFVENHKQLRREQLLNREGLSGTTADIVPGIQPSTLYDLLPSDTTNDAGVLVRTEFRMLADPRTKNLSRKTLERLAQVPGVVLPNWLTQVLDENIHFNPVRSIEDAGMEEVFDISVPETHAFVANGVINHNTVNVVETATVDDIERIYMEGWKLGLKALAVYRDNCKVGQPLSTKKAELDEVGQQAVIPVRNRLPQTRNSKTTKFEISSVEGYLTTGEYDDGTLGEIFIRVSKQGSTLSGMMDGLAMAVSVGLQYGVPLETFVAKYINSSFDPSGMTNDPEIRIAKSLLDYMFRRLAIEYLDVDTRQAYGIYTIAERTEAVNSPGTPAVVAPANTVVAAPAPAKEKTIHEPDIPMCITCGTSTYMQRSGSCYACTACGNTTGCS